MWNLFLISLFFLSIFAAKTWSQNPRWSAIENLGFAAAHLVAKTFVSTRWNLTNRTTKLCICFTFPGMQCHTATQKGSCKRTIYPCSKLQPWHQHVTNNVSATKLATMFLTGLHWSSESESKPCELCSSALQKASSLESSSGCPSMRSHSLVLKLQLAVHEEQVCTCGQLEVQLSQQHGRLQKDPQQHS